MKWNRVPFAVIAAALLLPALAACGDSGGKGAASPSTQPDPKVTPPADKSAPADMVTYECKMDGKTETVAAGLPAPSC